MQTRKKKRMVDEADNGSILLIIEQEDIQTRMQCEGRREEAQSRKQKGVREIREVEAQSGEVKKESRMTKH